MSDQKHDHHDHDHGSITHSLLPSDPALRVKAIETLLVEKGLVDPAAVDALIDAFQTKIGPNIGAKVIAKAWIDPAFKQALLKNAGKAIADIGASEIPAEQLIAVENTEQVHNLVVCTLCSCYPWAILGLPPSWYKSSAYRSRAVKEPRSVLLEFGVALSDQTEVRVWDSTAELRYLVIPQRPPGSEGMSEAQLAALVTRDSMVGVALITA
jgi:nitrile hydratase subunit alpha